MSNNSTRAYLWSDGFYRTEPEYKAISELLVRQYAEIKSRAYSYSWAPKSSQDMIARHEAERNLLQGEMHKLIDDKSSQYAATKE